MAPPSAYICTRIIEGRVGGSRGATLARRFDLTDPALAAVFLILARFSATSHGFLS
jgi:hypothetical protein